MTTFALGVDVASFQGKPNWKEAHKAGYRFAYVKTTQSPGYVNPLAKDQRHGAYEAGFAIGNYCYGVAKIGDPVAQAHYFLSQSDIRPWHLLPFLDLEEIGSEGVKPRDLEHFAYTWALEVTRFFKIPFVILYTDLNMLRNRVYQSRRLRNIFLLDVADWTLGPAPKVPGWRVVLHQFDTAHNVPGFAANVDRDRALVPLDHLHIDWWQGWKADHSPPLKRCRKLLHPSWWNPHP